MEEKHLSNDETTRLVTAIRYLGAGDAAVKDLQSRIDTLALDTRIEVGEIEFENGRPTCGVTFNCGSYDAPVDGTPDPQAVKDLNKLLDGINLDACVDWKAFALDTLTHA